MCLALPGKVIERIDPPEAIEDADALPFARVQFGTVTREVCVAYTPDVQPGEYVIVHVGFALQVLDEKAALETLAAFDEAKLE